MAAPVANHDSLLTNHRFLGNTAPTSLCGRAMTCTLTRSPLMALTAWAPASVAALTAATSPMTTAVTRALPTCVMGPASSTFAALSMASVASTSATRPRVSISPIASCAIGRSYDLRVTSCGFWDAIEEKTLHFTGDNEFFVGRDHHHFHARIRGTDEPFRRPEGVVFRGVDDDTELLETRADRRPELDAVFPDAGGE